MNGFQIAYCIGLALLFAVRGASITPSILLGNMLATLGVCYAMDVDVIGRSDATLWQMTIDVLSGSALAMFAGLPRLVAIGYVVTTPIYVANAFLLFSDATTFAIVNAAAGIQLAVAIIGKGSNTGGRSHRRWLSAVFPARVQAGFGGNGQGGLASAKGMVSRDGGVT